MDLYGQDGDGISRWVSVIGPEEQKVEKSIAKGLAPGYRKILCIYLYIMELIKWKLVLIMVIFLIHCIPHKENQSFFYGTSITQGASASRLGLRKF